MRRRCDEDLFMRSEWQSRTNPMNGDDDGDSEG